MNGDPHVAFLQRYNFFAILASIYEINMKVTHFSYHLLLQKNEPVPPSGFVRNVI